jgi:hypothetical protein
MRRPLIIVLVLVAVALGAWTGGWYIASQQLIRAIDRWAEARRAEGWQVSYGPAAPSGFPTRVAVQIADPAVSAPARGTEAPAWNWSAPTVRVEIVPWRLDRVVVRNRGLNKLGLVRDGRRLDATLDTDGAMVRLEAGRPEDTGHYVVELEHPKLEIAEPTVHAQATRLGLDLRLIRTPPGDHLAVAAVLGLGVDELESTLLGRADVPQVTMNLEAELMGAIAAGPPDQTVAAWRDDGGTVEVRRLRFSSAGITVNANGTLALDNEMRPMGAASAAIRGYDAAIDRLTAAGTVSPRDAQLAKLLLAAIATPSDGGERVLNVPITGQNGWLYVGPVRLTRLEPLKLR